VTVGSYDPDAEASGLGAAEIAEFLGAAGALEEPDFRLSRDRIGALAALARHDAHCDWAAAAANLSSAELESLVRLFTLAERLPGWDAGARSPVIVLVAELKRRDAYPEALTAWIKANTNNRFLPYGSLLDRL
jgi:hypothetical protein